ncbi:hypothetical protein Agabi119p4_5168 [Agaricus bisporus var. burnettii]|uniref:ATP-dependent DNA helicase n=1 Tax=Agaricus bisporus var. burnettii TaxID=192524 RepID=A0A8H7KI04_AGABI|nr:hypothetical protein Agabi119p4_5168 [Agaricus bisporus var. burnettii]
MGGIVTVLGGDWNQCLPVIEQGSREEIIGASLQRSYLWPSICLLKLSTNMRIHDTSSSASSFLSWLESVGNGTANNLHGTVPIPPSMLMCSTSSLLHHVYHDISERHICPPPFYFASRSILAPHNIVVDDINDQLLNEFPGDIHTFPSADTIVDDDGSTEPISSDIAIDDVHSLNLPNFPPAELHVKIGCPLILLCNLNPAQGLCNRTRMVLFRAANRVLEVLLLTGDHANERAFIPRISLYPHHVPLPFHFKCRQFPLRLAFAMTINKSEGQTLETVGIDLRSPVFAHGQLYVPLSRTTNPHNLFILLPSDSSQPPSTTTLNVVYPELLI